MVCSVSRVPLNHSQALEGAAQKYISSTGNPVAALCPGASMVGAKALHYIVNVIRTSGKLPC